MRPVAERLIELGADVHEWDNIDDGTTNSIHSFNVMGYAVASNNAGYIDLLLENGAELEFNEPKKYTAPQILGIMGSEVTTKELCDLGANMNSKSAYINHTPLFLANQRNNGKHEWYGNFPETVQALKDCGGYA